MADLSLDHLPGPDLAAGRRVRERADRVLRPRGALDRLDGLAVWLAEWQGTERPSVERPGAIVFLADHGVAEEGVSAYPASITRVMLAALEAGVATVSVMAEILGVQLQTVDVGVGSPTGNIRREAALTEDRFAACVAAGEEAVRSMETDLLVLGELGIGNTTAASAICIALFGGSPAQWVGTGSGLDEDGLARKRKVVAEAVSRADVKTPFDAMSQLGGAELVALAGAVLEARRRSIPVLLDGFVATAAVVPLEIARAGALAHCWPGHLSPEPGHRILLDHLGRPPILDLGMRLGEGTGALAALPLVRLSVAAVLGVATFDEWSLR